MTRSLTLHPAPMAAQLSPTPDPETCAHRRVQNNWPLTAEDGGSHGHYLRQVAVCLDCRARVVRVTDFVKLGPWRTERSLFKRGPSR